MKGKPALEWQRATSADLNFNTDGWTEGQVDVLRWQTLLGVHHSDESPFTHKWPDARAWGGVSLSLCEQYKGAGRLDRLSVRLTGHVSFFFNRVSQVLCLVDSAPLQLHLGGKDCVAIEDASVAITLWKVVIWTQARQKISKWESHIWGGSHSGETSSR